MSATTDTPTYYITYNRAPVQYSLALEIILHKNQVVESFMRFGIILRKLPTTLGQRDALSCHEL